MTETLEELDARLLATYGKNYAKRLSPEEYKAQLAKLTAPLPEPVLELTKHARDMTPDEWRAAKAKIGYRYR